MIEIIKTDVSMPPYPERRYQKWMRREKWIVVDTIDGSVRYRGTYEGVVLACHNLNKAHYLQIAEDLEKEKKEAVLTHIKNRK
jgi:hypothetical protein